MLLNFKKQFRPMILDGSKTHTIRDERKDGKRPVPGEILHLYTGLRQKGAAFILRAPCLRTEDCCIDGSWGPFGVFLGGGIWIGGIKLDLVERESLAWADGFRPYGATIAGSFENMMKFWKGRLPFAGWITYWDFSKADFIRKPKRERG